ncbi:MAG TPA: DNA repair protein RecO [Bacteroidales bacterium]|jgi:DNA repair protein RecO (recombination protein O)|nr:DNA repair protein RecO [Bacteroidales bacterium]OQB62974.1 MAG: DNA repair protein RecO [Bacteroidetes bacterium ADurb.Bin145]HOU01572.1 DNA repair protein RecO [Bacteroidales bacterium]HQG63985.1 DNA repair protein RecO [Bacteroidales bacterium]
MIEKTKGIVLHQIKYSDSGIIVQLYTSTFGRQSLLVKGLRNKKSGRHNILFQPLTILDAVIYYKESRGMPVLKEFSVFYSPAMIYSDIRKTSMAMFLGEALTTILREETPNNSLFTFLEESIIYFDKCPESFANFHIAFLAGLSSYLGFEPAPCNKAQDVYFDLLNGIFVPSPPMHSNYSDPDISGVLARFFSTSYDNSRDINLTGAVRNEVLETLIKYYSTHLPGLRRIKSLEILKEVFR